MAIIAVTVIKSMSKYLSSYYTIIKCLLLKRQTLSGDEKKNTLTQPKQHVNISNTIFRKCMRNL